MSGPRPASRGGGVSPEFAVWLLVLAGVMVFFLVVPLLSRSTKETIKGCMLIILVVGGVVAAINELLR